MKDSNLARRLKQNGLISNTGALYIKCLSNEDFRKIMLWIKTLQIKQGYFRITYDILQSNCSLGNTPNFVVYINKNKIEASVIYAAPDSIGLSSDDIFKPYILEYMAELSQKCADVQNAKRKSREGRILVVQ
jgi:hypothetical protein